MTTEYRDNNLTLMDFLNRNRINIIKIRKNIGIILSRIFKIFPINCVNDKDNSNLIYYALTIIAALVKKKKRNDKVSFSI